MSRLASIAAKWTFSSKQDVQMMMIETDPGLNRLQRAYRSVDWSLRQPWNEGEDGVIVPKWAIYTLIEASQARNATKHERQMWQIVGLSGILLVSVGIFIGIVLFGGG